MQCLSCASHHASPSHLHVCLEPDCKRTIECAYCLMTHPPWHKQKHHKASTFLTSIVSNLPTPDALQKLCQTSHLDDFVLAFNKFNLYITQFRAMLTHSLDNLTAKVSQLYQSLLSSYTANQSRLFTLETQYQLVQNIIKGQDCNQASLEQLIKQYQSASFTQPKTPPSRTKSNPNSNSSSKKIPSYEYQIDIAHLIKQYYESQNEVKAFSDFIGVSMHQDIETTSSKLLEAIQHALSFIERVASKGSECDGAVTKQQQNQTRPITTTNKFLDSLLPLFSKEEHIVCFKNNMPVQAMVLSKTCNQIITASFDCNLVVRDMFTLEEIQVVPAHSQWVRSIVIHEKIGDTQGTLVSCGDDKLIQVWELNSNNTNDHHGNLKASELRIMLKTCLLCILSENTLAACAGPQENFAILVYDLRTGNQLRVHRGHKKAIRSIAAITHQNEFCTGDDEGVLYIWQSKSPPLVNPQSSLQSPMKQEQRFKCRQHITTSPIVSLLHEYSHSLIVAGCQDGKVIVMTAARLKVLRVITCSMSLSVNALQRLNATYLAVAVGKMCLTYEFVSGNLVNTVQNKNGNNIATMAYSAYYQKLYIGDVRGHLTSYSVLINK